jgi:ATP-binding protein involved in chromosome partitioning
MTVTVQDLSAALQAIVDPNTGKDLVTGKSARNIRVDGADVAVDASLAASFSWSARIRWGPFA